MTDQHSQSSSAAPERVWGLWIATAFGSFFLFFLVGLFQSGDPEWTILTYGLALLFTAWSGLMTAGGIGKLLGRPWGERLVESCLGIGAVALFTGMVGSTCWEAYQRIVGHEPAEPGDGALLLVTLLWAGSVALFWRSDNPQEPRRFEPAVLLWPLLLLLLEPVAFGLLFLPVVLFVVGGDLLGSRFGQPYLGATIGLICAVALFATLARLSRNWP